MGLIELDGNDGMQSGSCPNRAESMPMNTTTRSLVLQNYFPNNPNASAVCADNSAALASMLQTCYEAAGKRWPNFIAVDYYQVSILSTFLSPTISYLKLDLIFLNSLDAEERRRRSTGGSRSSQWPADMWM